MHHNGSFAKLVAVSQVKKTRNLGVASAVKALRINSGRGAALNGAGGSGDTLLVVKLLKCLTLHTKHLDRVGIGI